MNKTDLRRAILAQQQSLMNGLAQVEAATQSDPEASIGDHVNAAVMRALHRGHIAGLAQALDLVEQLEEGFVLAARPPGGLDLSFTASEGFGRGLTLVDLEDGDDV